jgi:hypothetical protein
MDGSEPHRIPGVQVMDAPVMHPCNGLRMGNLFTCSTWANSQPEWNVSNHYWQTQFVEGNSVTAKELQEVFGAMPRSRIALEIGTHSPWISRLLSELGYEVSANLDGFAPWWACAMRLQS